MPHISKIKINGGTAVSRAASSYSLLHEVHIARFYPTAGLKADGKTGTLDIRAFIAAAQDASFHRIFIQRKG